MPMQPLRMVPMGPQPAMAYRHVGRSELVVSAIGFGCWPMGGTQYGPVDDQEVTRAVHRALELGITCFDTAPAYGHGHAEEVLGRALGRFRTSAVVVTKCGMTWDPGSQPLVLRRDSSRAALLDGPGGLHASLRRLGTDYVDLWLVHWPDPNTPLQETMETLVEARQAGKVRYVGVSNFTAAQLQESLHHAPLIANQVGFNLFDRRWEREVFPTCRAFGVGVMAYGSLAHGLLTGAWTEETKLEEWDWRSRGGAFGQQLFTSEHLPQNLAVVAKLEEIARRKGVRLPQLALAWVLRNPAVSVGLVGVRTPAELGQNVGALGVGFSDAELAEIDQIIQGAAGLSEAVPK